MAMQKVRGPVERIDDPGWPRRRFVVRIPSWPSSATIAWSGWLSRMTATQASCAARSVADT